MSVKVQEWVFENSEAAGDDRLVLLAIADEADDDGLNAHPSVRRVAHKARVNERTTMRCIERLEAAGRLTVIRPEKRGHGSLNSYVVICPPPTPPRPEAPPRLSVPHVGCYLYRLWTVEDRLLYVGVSVRLAARLTTHRRRWGDLIDRATWEEYPDEVSMLLAEAIAIRDEDPALNKASIRGPV